MFCKVLEEGGRGRGWGIEYSVRFYERGGGEGKGMGSKAGSQSISHGKREWDRDGGNPSYLSAGCSAVILY
jgi:hypothetical protein